LTVHFGLGAEKEAKIEIRWPSGKTQVMLNVPADQRIVITEATS
jgi:hypothetical protein